MSATTVPVSSSRRTTPAGISGWQGLQIQREDIEFITPRPGVLQVELTVRNDSPEPTLPATALLGSAPLGAFVPWQLLDILDVPSIAPGESRVIKRAYRYTPPQPLGSVDKLPPDRVLTALGLGEPERNRRRSVVSSASMTTPGLAPDLMTLLHQGSPHWAGNLNLFFPGVEVERHVARALRVYPGRVNLAMFIVGNLADEYQFQLTGDAVAWNARLFDTSHGRPIADGISNPELEERSWNRPATGVLLLAIEPPSEAETGAVNVHVRQRSSNRKAVVEFTMDSRAAGPGCFRL